MDSVAVRFKTIRIALGLTQSDLGRKVGLSTSAISDIEHGKMSPNINVQKALFRLGGSSRYLLFGEGPPVIDAEHPAADGAHYVSQENEIRPVKGKNVFESGEIAQPKLKSNARLIDMRTEMVSIPVVASVSAGPGIFDDVNVLDNIFFPAMLLKGFNFDHLFCVIVDGESMIPEFKPGDEVISSIDFPFTRQDSGKFAVIHTPDDGNIIKKIVYCNDGLELHSTNPDFPMRKLTREEAKQTAAFKIIRLQRSFF